MLRPSWKDPQSPGDAVGVRDHLGVGLTEPYDSGDTGGIYLVNSVAQEAPGVYGTSRRRLLGKQVPDYGSSLVRQSARRCGPPAAALWSAGTAAVATTLTDRASVDRTHRGLHPLPTPVVSPVGLAGPLTTLGEVAGNEAAYGVQNSYATEVRTVTTAPTTAGTSVGTALSARATPKAVAKKTPTRKTPAKKTTTRRATAKGATPAKALTAAGRTPRFNCQGAAEHAIHKHTVRITLPVFGPVKLPATEKLAFYAGLAAVAVLGIVEWPVVAVISVGHLLAEDRHNQLVRDFGLALEEAV